MPPSIEMTFRYPHLLQTLGGEGRAEATAAVEDDLRVLVRDGRLDVALEDASSEMARAGGMIASVLFVLADIDELERFTPIETRLHVADGALTNARLRIVHELQETRTVLHGRPPPRTILRPPAP
jgi:hypothetical protein